MNFPLLPIDRIGSPLRHKIETVEALGGDTRFFRFAANAPHIVRLYWVQFYEEVFFKGVLPVRLKEIARLRLAALNGCSFCQVGDRASALAHGVSEQEVEALFGDGQSASFSQAEQAAADAASRMSNFDPEGVLGEDLRQTLQRCFQPAELVELLAVIGILTGMARMLLASGFITRTCEVRPE
ncbi:MAG: carboxymuconolactone decarboxylase family protein [Variovorax sp.]|nr:carboxymuconolactone decarboxylase family protein [Variovorax sp.]